MGYQEQREMAEGPVWCVCVSVYFFEAVNDDMNDEPLCVEAEEPLCEMHYMYFLPLALSPSFKWFFFYPACATLVWTRWEICF